MLFNSISFAIFLPVVFLLYWFLFKKNLKFQNVLLLTASYFFYSCWDWRFLFLLIFSTILDYFTGIKIYNAKTSLAEKIWLWISITINISFLGVFKYYNFFASSFTVFLSELGIQAHTETLNVILPVGISFYTFHGLSYVIDIYYRKITPEKNYVTYALFVSFFPLLVAGPIERASHLLPQLKIPRFFSYARSIDGLKQILWGLFKKVVVADQCGELADIMFDSSGDYTGSTFFLGALFFTFQIYGDFSGYSDIALGTARLFGIELLRNFAYPYFSRDFAEFWRRWHISLSSWFRDYIYIPLGGSKVGVLKRVRNTFIIFLVSGFWHGANWTFLAWGALNALFILPSIIFRTNRVNLDIVALSRNFPSIKDFFSIATTFMLTVFAWIFFRAKDLSSAFEYISNTLNSTLFQLPDGIAFHSSTFHPAITLIFIAIMVIIEWFGRESAYGIMNIMRNWPTLFRYGFYYSLAMTILLFAIKGKQFIYFQF